MNNGEGCLAIIGVIVLAAIGVGITAWILMLLLGALASMTGWNCAIGFWPTLVIVWILSIIGSVLNNNNTSN